MENSTIVEYETVEPFRRGNGVLIRLLFGKKNASDTSFTSGATVFPAGYSAPMHTHNCTEQVTIVKGDAEVTVDGVTKRIGVMDTSFIPLLATTATLYIPVANRIACSRMVLNL